MAQNRRVNSQVGINARDVGIDYRVGQLLPTLRLPLVCVGSPERAIAVRREDADHDGGSLWYEDLVHALAVATFNGRRKGENGILDGSM